VIAFAIALSMLLRGRRAVHWLFAAFATDVAFWYVSQSLGDLFKDATWVRVTAVVTVLLPQFAVHLFETVVPRSDKVLPSRLPKIATAMGVPMLALELSPYNDTSISLGLCVSVVCVPTVVLVTGWGTTDVTSAPKSTEKLVVLVAPKATPLVFLSPLLTTT